ncbi:DNA repair protein Rad52 [bacterium]|nr:DNA repair protein Rad52 [bacterium]MBU1990816.1 DNA repair protein Rad52 [bacterium]
MFNDKQNQVLAYELDNSRVKSRSKGNITLSYLEGHDILEAANRIFGYGNWSSKISSLEQVSQESNSNQNTIVCYKATVIVTIFDMQHSKQISREDVGFGTGIAKILADAHEGGAKEAITDAIKRSFRSFGNQFGNSLYGKIQQQSNAPQSYQQPVQLQQPQQQYQQPPSQQMQNNTPLDYSSLYNIGLTIMEQGQNLVVLGDDIFSKKDSIKACGFRWDGASKMWFKPIEQQVA